MDPNEQRIKKQVVVNSLGQRSEVLTERTDRVPQESRLPAGTIALIAVIAIVAIGAVLYIVVNRNENEAANRNANLEAAQTNSHQPTTIVQQPAQPAPVIIQQPAGGQQAPVIIQQPAQPGSRENTSANDDAAMQDVATKKLIEDPNMTGVVMTVTDARVVLTGTVSTAANKARAEQIVKAIRGVKSVDNQIVVTG